jgi:uncharacterized repeat protein (TIGR03803 family)
LFKLDAGCKLSVLHNFHYKHGNSPQADLLRDASGNLYGSTRGGGDVNCNRGGGCGTVFKLDKTGKKTILYSFTDEVDGNIPDVLIRDNKGNFFGVAWQGGDLSGCGGTGCGTVFKLVSSHQETVLYRFSGGIDGANPNPALIRDASGNLYGVTEDGGDLNCYGNIGCGTVFEVDTAGNETVLHTFTESDGQFARGLMRDAAGRLYGTTYSGGSNKCLYGCGVVFSLTP